LLAVAFEGSGQWDASDGELTATFDVRDRDGAPFPTTQANHGEFDMCFHGPPIHSLAVNVPNSWPMRAYGRLVALISIGVFIGGCASTDVLGDKEEYARQSGKGAVVGIHQGLDAIDDPLIAKARATLMDDETLHRTVAQLVQAAVIGARQGIADVHVDAIAAEIIEAIASTLDRHAQQTGQKLLDAAGATAYSTSVRSVRDSVTAASQSFDAASPQISAAMRTIVAASIASAADVISERFEQKAMEVMNGRLPQFAGAISRTAAREAVGGFKQGLLEDFPEFFPRPQFLADGIRIALIVAASMLLVLVIVGVVVIAKLMRSDRLSRQALYALAQKVEEHGSPELKAALRSSPMSATDYAESLRDRGV
jgi:hypothetical protein